MCCIRTLRITSTKPHNITRETSQCVQLFIQYLLLLQQTSFAPGAGRGGRERPRSGPLSAAPPPPPPPPPPLQPPGCASATLWMHRVAFFPSHDNRTA